MKNSTINKKLSLTVGITTCYGEYSILDTVKSVRESINLPDFRFIIIADRVPISAKIKKELKRYNVELIENKKESGQIKKKKQILDISQSDVIIFTQDDVIFERDALSKVMNAFETDQKLTFASIRNIPVKPTSFVEAIISVGTKISHAVAAKWNNGDNYLTVVGRCEAFRASFALKKFRFIDKIVSTDAFFYFENKSKNGKYKFIKNAGLYYKNPQKLDIYYKKSSRFSLQKKQMSMYFSDLNSEYDIPKPILFASIIHELLFNPFFTIIYLVIFLSGRILKHDFKTAMDARKWDLDLSTKKVV